MKQRQLVFVYGIKQTHTSFDVFLIITDQLIEFVGLGAGFILIRAYFQSIDCRCHSFQHLPVTVL
jgi:hypothetical protein